MILLWWFILLVIFVIVYCLRVWNLRHNANDSLFDVKKKPVGCPDYPGYIIIDDDIDFDQALNFRYQYHREVCKEPNHNNKCKIFSHYTSIMNCKPRTPEMINEIKEQLSVPLTIIIRSSGGHYLASKMITQLLDDHQGHKTCYIDNYAFSAGSVIAMHCQQIKMNSKSMLSPIDTQYSINDDKSFSYLQLLNDVILCARYDIEYEDVIKTCQKDEKHARFILQIHKSKVPVRRFKKKFMSLEADHHEKEYSYNDIKHLGLNILFGEFPLDIRRVIYNHFIFYNKLDRKLISASYSIF